MNRFLIVFALVLGVFVLCPMLWAQDGVTYSTLDTMSVVDNYGKPGDTVNVYLNMANWTTEVAALGARITYDSTLLTAISVSSYGRGTNLNSFSSNLTTPGIIKILAYNLSSGSPIPQGSDAVAIIKFYVKSTATMGSVSLLKFVDQEKYENSWSNDQAELIIPILSLGRFIVWGPGVELPPIMSDIGNQTVNEGEILRFSVRSYDLNGDSITLAMSQVPPNASFPTVKGDSVVTGTFQFKPDYNQGPDTIDVSFVASDGKGITTKTIQIAIIDKLPPNPPPIIQGLADHELTEGDTLKFVVRAYDLDGEKLTLEASNLPLNASFSKVEGDSVVEGLFKFMPDFDQGPDTFYVDFVATDYFDNSSTQTIRLIVRDYIEDFLTADSTQGALAGVQNRTVDIVLFNQVPVWGAQFDLFYDPTQIEIQDIITTHKSLDFGFWYNEPTPGRIIVLIFSVGLDSIDIGEGPLAQLIVNVDEQANWGHTPLSFDKAVEVIDTVGTTQNLVMIHSFFTVDRLGDANLDGIMNVGDCILVVASIVGRTTLTERQSDAANINRDTQISISDLQTIINTILELEVEPYTMPSYPLVYVELPENLSSSSGDFLTVPLLAEVNIEAAAVQFELSFDPQSLEAVEVAAGQMVSDMRLDYTIDNKGKIKGVIYNLSGATFGPTEGELVDFEFKVKKDSFDMNSLKITEFMIVNLAADLIPSEVKGQLPDQYYLHQNYPNPFNATTTIGFELPTQGGVDLSVYDILGRKVTTLVNDVLAAGDHKIVWNGCSDSGEMVATGIYFYRLQASGFDQSKKMLLVK